jgi:hypothetical protein
MFQGTDSSDSLLLLLSIPWGLFLVVYISVLLLVIMIACYVKNSRLRGRMYAAILALLILNFLVFVAATSFRRFL